MNKNSSSGSYRLIHANQVKIMYIVAGYLAGFSVLLMYFRIGGSKSSYVSLMALAISSYVAVASIAFSRIQQQKRRRERVFIIYSHSDLEQAKLVSEALKVHGFHPWLDVEEIRPGQRWLAAIEKGLNECSSALLLVSANLDITNETIAQEIGIAMSTMRSRDETFSHVIPVILDDTPIPDILKDVYAAKFDRNEGMDSLAKGLARVLRGA